MKEEGRILIVDDDEDILIAGKLLLSRKFTHVATCNRPEHIPDFLKQQRFDAILLDMNFNPGESDGKQGFYWLNKIIALQPDSSIIMITAHGGVDVAVEAMKLGATDFIAKPWQNEKVIATLSTAVQLGRVKSEAQLLRQKNKILVQATYQSVEHDIIGSSDAINHIHALIAKAAPTDANVLILGENGTGKELFAKQIHKQSSRSDQVFMSVDLGAISESLFESELFGHKKGTFTGANQDRIGRLSAANGGTLFLDEIGNLPLHLQTKLLTVLEQRKVTPIGANTAIDIDVRVIAATNTRKEILTDERHFRQDLLFRLNTVELNLPALRERAEDIIPITKHFIHLYSKKYQKPIEQLSESAELALKSNPWSGNIRALRHAIERAIILCDSTVLTAEDFQLSPLNSHQVAVLNTDRPDKVNEGNANDSSVNIGNVNVGNTATSTLPLEQSAPIGSYNLETIEKQTISQALKKYRYNISHTAKALGLTRAALYRRMEKHDL